MTDKCSMFEMGDKEVINLHDGMRLGYITDAEIDVKTGQVVCFIIEGRRKFFGLMGKDPDISIKWDEIEKIGEDLILVRRESVTVKRLPEKRFYY